MTTNAQFAARMVRWIREQLAPPGADVHAETLLFKDGILSSIKVLELIAWTEREIGRIITDAEIRLDNFRTVQRIADVFGSADIDAPR